MAFGDPYISQAALKSYLGIDDDVDNTRVDGAIAAARAQTEDYCHRQFNRGTGVATRVFHVPYNTSVGRVDDFHTLTGLVVKVGSATGGYTDTWTIDTDFVATPINQTRNESPQNQPYWRIKALLNRQFPYNARGETNLQVTADWGWSSVPEEVVEANKILAARLFRRRESPDGVIGGFEGNPIRVGWMMDPDAEKLLKGFRKHVTGAFC